MRLFALLLGATALTATTAAANTVQLKLTYDNIQQRFSPDTDPFDGVENAEGFLYPNDGAIYGPFNPKNDPNNFQYDPTYEQRQLDAADWMLQEIFDDRRTNGGATFSEASNEWIYNEDPTNTVELFVTLDTSLFDLTPDFFTAASVTGDIDLLGSMTTSISYISRDSGGNVIGAETLFDFTEVGAGVNASVGETETADLLAFGAYRDEIPYAADAYTAISDIALGFYFTDPAADSDPNDAITGDWFSQALLDGSDNALEYALNTSGFTRIFEYEEVWVGTNGDGNQQTMGTKFVQGELLSFAVVDGSLENPFLPTSVATNAEGAPVYEFDILVPEAQEGQPREPIWIDPDIAVGYIYDIKDENGDAVAITGIQAPGTDLVADGEYTLELVLSDGSSVENITLLSGAPLLFADVPGVGGLDVVQVILTGIDPSLGLDPNNPVLFQTGLLTDASGLLTFSQEAIAIPHPEDDMAPSAVPLPMPALMLLSGLAGLGLLRRRKAA